MALHPYHARLGLTGGRKGVPSSGYPFPVSSIPLPVQGTLPPPPTPPGQDHDRMYPPFPSVNRRTDTTEDTIIPSLMLPYVVGKKKIPLNGYQTHHRKRSAVGKKILEKVSILNGNTGVDYVTDVTS